MDKTLSVKITEQGKKKLGQALRDFRESKGWSLREAANYISERTGDGSIGFTSLNQIEKGYRDISMEKLLLLSQIGYGDMGFSEMVNILTSSRLCLCEKGSDYRVSKDEAIAV